MITLIPLKEEYSIMVIFKSELNYTRLALQNIRELELIPEYGVIPIEVVDDYLFLSFDGL